MKHHLSHTNSKINDAIQIIQAGMSVTNLDDIIKKHLNTFDESDSIYIVAYGKASVIMTESVGKLFSVRGGVVILPSGYNHNLNSSKYDILYADHPTPSENSIYAAKHVLSFLKQRSPNDLVLFLISGGGSSLLCLPFGTSLKNKSTIINNLSDLGANIHELNCVRKHLSAIKGGKMVENLPCKAISLVLSDVQNNDLTVISSGCTYFDSTTFSDAISILQKYHLQDDYPDITRHFLDGASGQIPETSKSTTIPHIILLSNQDCLDAMNACAKNLGYTSNILSIYDDVENCASFILDSFDESEKSCLIFGGEPTVRKSGNGLGGRNQQLVLHLLHLVQNNPKKLIFGSVGTDGIDGNTKYAGALVENVKNDDIATFLKNNDSSTFFEKYGGLIKLGPTNTNLLDIGIILY